MKVTAERLEEMNLLGLFMKAALEERLEALERQRPRGEIVVESGGMSITLSCQPGRVLITKGVAANADAKLSGELGALAAVASGRMIDPLLRRRVRVSGNPVKLLGLARVFREAG
jgi:predicted lipid carrier protein YhbT